MPDAAYCSACKRYVLVTGDGTCEAGHPRPKLRNLYDAELDRRTGRPKPPKLVAANRSPRLVVAPAAPRVFEPLLAPAVPVSRQPSPVAEVAVAQVSPIETDRIPEPKAAPATPFADQVAAPACVPAAAGDGVIGRLFGPPRGRHSSGSHDPARRTMIALLLVIALVGATVAAEVAATFGAFDTLQEPAVIALAE